MKIVQTGPYVSKAVYSWWDCVISIWPIELITKWWHYKRLANNLTKAFQKSVAQVKSTGKNIEQLNEERQK